jgi:hypothetical protein
MNTSKVERRSHQYRNSQGEKFDAAVVRHGLMLKLEGNMVSAIEYMHNRVFLLTPSSVFCRVLN